MRGYMEFSRKKLPKEDLSQLYRVRIETIQPFALMISPAYLYFKANEKFVSVKGPLDFFTPPEISRLKKFKYFYFPSFVASILPFREAGQKVQALLSCSDAIVESTSENPFPAIRLAPPSYEVADCVLKILGPLWWEYPNQGAGIEPYLVTIFVNELCQLLPEGQLLLGREKDVEKLDHALFRSSWVVFLALHLGYCDLNFLNDLRLRILSVNMNDTAPVRYWNELDELISLSYDSLKNTRVRLIHANFFSDRSEKIAQKLEARLARVLSHFMSKGSQPPSIFGKRGFIDV